MAGRKPKSRRRSTGTRDEFDLARVLDFLAREYGWDARYIEHSLTDEQLVAYLDAAADRLGEQERHGFETAVEAVRLGQGFLHDKSAYGRWKSRIRRRSEALSGQALEAAVMSLARRNPEYVVVG